MDACVPEGEKRRDHTKIYSFIVQILCYLEQQTFARNCDHSVYLGGNSNSRGHIISALYTPAGCYALLEGT